MTHAFASLFPVSHLFAAHGAALQQLPGQHPLQTEGADPESIHDSHWPWQPGRQGIPQQMEIQKHPLQQSLQSMRVAHSMLAVLQATWKSLLHSIPANQPGFDERDQWG